MFVPTFIIKVSKRRSCSTPVMRIKNIIIGFTKSMRTTRHIVGPNPSMIAMTTLKWNVGDGWSSD